MNSTAITYLAGNVTSCDCTNLPIAEQPSHGHGQVNPVQKNNERQALAPQLRTGVLVDHESNNNKRRTPEKEALRQKLKPFIRNFVITTVDKPSPSKRIKRNSRLDSAKENDVYDTKISSFKF